MDIVSDIKQWRLYIPHIYGYLLPMQNINNRKLQPLILTAGRLWALQDLLVKNGIVVCIHSGPYLKASRVAI